MTTFIYLALTSASDTLIAYGLLLVTNMKEPKLLSNELQDYTTCLKVVEQLFTSFTSVK